MSIRGYEVKCHYARGRLTTRCMVEWHTTLASALEGMLWHQQGPWDSVELHPVLVVATTQEDIMEESPQLVLWKERQGNGLCMP